MGFTDSDRFATLRGLQSMEPFAQITRPPLPPLHVVVDANFTLRCILEKASMRKAEARTKLEEVVDAGAVLAFAPPLLLDEIDKHAPRMFEEAGVDFRSAPAARAAILRRIRLFRPRRSRTAAVKRLREADADDVPYAQVFEHLHLDVALTSDEHWATTGYPSIASRGENTSQIGDIDLLNDLQAYVRAAAPIYALNSVTFLSVLGGSGLLRAVAGAPDVVKVALLAGAAVAALNSGMRAKIASAARIFSGALSSDPNFRVGIARIADGQVTLAGRETKALAWHTKFRRGVASGIHALRAVAASEVPLSTANVARTMSFAGWRSGGDDPIAEAELALGERPEVEVVNSAWRIRERFRARELDDTP